VEDVARLRRRRRLDDVHGRAVVGHVYNDDADGVEAVLAPAGAPRQFLDAGDALGQRCAPVTCSGSAALR
jgi:hypothetical protein